MAITRESYIEEGKFGSETHNYDDFASKTVRSMSVVKDNFSQSTGISASFEKPAGTDGTRLKETIEGLLRHAGFKDIEFKDYGTASFSVSVPERPGQGLANFAIALAKTVDIDRHDTHFAVLDPKDAREIVTQELERTGMTPEQAGLVKISTVTLGDYSTQMRGLKQDTVYVDVDLEDYPLSPILKVSENSRMAGSKFSGDQEKYTRVFMKDNNDTVQVQKALEDAGLSPKISDDGSRITVDVTADVLSNALARSGMMPDAVASDIGKAVAPAPEAPKAAPAAAAPVMTAGK